MRSVWSVFDVLVVDVRVSVVACFCWLLSFAVDCGWWSLRRSCSCLFSFVLTGVCYLLVCLSFDLVLVVVIVY